MIDQLLMIYNYPYSSFHDRLLAHYFLEKRKAIGNLSLSQIIAEIHLSKSTIIRFCCALGSKNFTHFKHNFMQDYQSSCIEFFQEETPLEMQIFMNKVCSCLQGKKQLIVFGDMTNYYVFAVYFKRFYRKGILIKYYTDTSHEEVDDQEDNVYMFLSTSLSLKVFYDYVSKTTLIKALYHHIHSLKSRSIVICVEDNLPINDIYYSFENSNQMINQIEFMKIMNGILASI